LSEVAPSELKQAVESLHGGTATYVQSVPVHAVLRGETAWNGAVAVFDLAGHLKAKRAYAWSHELPDGNRRFFAVLAKGVYHLTRKGRQGDYSGRSEGRKMNALRSAWLTLPIFLAACARPPAPASTAEIDAATANFGNCLGRAAEQFDDGKSDAATVGLAIEPVCATQFSQLVEVNGRSLNPAAYNLYLKKVRPHQLEFATGVVLKVRALRAQQQSN
jgi:hypothetical protein